MILFVLLSCHQNSFSVEKQNYELFQKAAEAHRVSDFLTEKAALQELRSRDPKSRAVLERLLYLYLQTNDLGEGVRLSDEHLQRRPGDREVRIARSKILLKSGFHERAVQDLQILLHNKHLHPWQIASDEFYRSYQHVPQLHSLVSFELIRLSSAVVPKTVLVGDTILVEFHFLHLSECDISIPPQFKTALVTLERLHVNTDKVDEYVSQTKIHFSWSTHHSGSVLWNGLQVTCANHSAMFDVGGVAILPFAKDSVVEEEFAIVLPERGTALEGTGRSVSVMYRQQGVPVLEGVVYPY